jgi:hypothetical protein
MIDFWEILGHVVTNDEFRKQMYEPFVHTKPKAVEGNAYACLFDPEDYSKAREIALQRVRPVSMMALGEWLVLATLARGCRGRLDGVADVVQRLLDGYRSASPLFYRTLGISIVDPNFKGCFEGGGERAYGFDLDPVDRDRLAAVIGDPEGEFGAAAEHFKSGGWDQSCKDMCFVWDDYPYAHNLEKPLTGYPPQ